MKSIRFDSIRFVEIRQLTRCTVSCLSLTKFSVRRSFRRISRSNSARRFSTSAICLKEKQEDDKFEEEKREFQRTLRDFSLEELRITFVNVVICPFVVEVHFVDVLQPCSNPNSIQIHSKKRKKEKRFDLP